ncbi:MAG: FliG C-terminal domain-containing protein, partial [Pirellulales bacterium]
QVLENELPQAIAAVIASLEPEHAAEVLEALPTAQSIEALARMANLSDMSPVVLHDLEEGLKIQLDPHIQAQSIRKESLAGIQRVLSALDGERRKSLLATMGRQNSPLVKQLGYLAGDDAPVSKISTSEAPLAESLKVSVAAAPAAMPSVTEVAAPIETINEADLPDLEELFFLPLAEVKQVFAEVSPEVAILAMTGAEPRLLEKFLKRLPQALAEDLQYRLAHPGPVRLRDLDRARLQVRQSLNALFEEEDEEETSTASWSA